MISDSVTLKKIKDALVSYSFLLPFLAFFLVFTIVPIGYVFYLSFQSGTFLDVSFKWTGFANFAKVLQSKDFINSFFNTLVYILIEVPVSQIISVFIALLLRKKNRVNGAFETIYFLPMLISMVAASVLIAYVLSSSGPINFLLNAVGASSVNWLGNPFTAKISVMILELWKGGTFFIFVYMAAIRGIPADCLEAAKIDGANVFQETVKITLPLLKNITMLCVIMNTIWQFQIFESVYMLTGGGPLKATETVIFTIYQYSFMFGKIGVGAAASVLFLFLILIISLLEMKLFKSDSEY